MNPPRYFPPRYFDAGYWGGEQVEGSISATLSGGGAVTASLTSATVIAQTSGGRRKPRSSYGFLDQKVRPEVAKPAFIEARCGGGSSFTASVFATVGIEADILAIGQLASSISAVAVGAADIAGASLTTARGATVDHWAMARKEEEFWLLVA